MAKKRKTLPDNMQEIIDSGDLELFRSVFDQCGISAVKRRKSTQNILSFRGLTPAHIGFLIANGIDVNANAGFDRPAVAHQAYSLENLKYLIQHGADINLTLRKEAGNALFYAAEFHMLPDVRNLLECGASADFRGGWYNRSVLEQSLDYCQNIDIINMAEIAKLLLNAGAEKSQACQEYVRRIGEHFEFMRPDYQGDNIDELSDALQELYQIFDVEPVPRRVVYDGKSEIKVKSDTWPKQHEELWKLLVPGSGHANTVQGEVIRITGRITNEILDNGGINWDEEYRRMTKALTEYFHSADGLESSLVEEACQLSKKVSSRSDEKLLYRLTELAVKWVLANSMPMALSEVSYRR